MQYLDLTLGDSGLDFNLEFRPRIAKILELLLKEKKKAPDIRVRAYLYFKINIQYNQYSVFQNVSNIKDRKGNCLHRPIHHKQGLGNHRRDYSPCRASVSHHRQYRQL